MMNAFRTLTVKGQSLPAREYRDLKKLSYWLLFNSGIFIA